MPMLKNDLTEILVEIKRMFPNAGCELIYHNHFELIIAVVLSAQTTDKSVNIVTPKLFEKYPDAIALSKANPQDVIAIIARIGLANNKSKNIIALANALVEKFDGNVPNNFDDLVMLPGVGRKTANVVLSEGFKINRIAVDTHVERVSKRLGIVNQNASVLDVENTLMNLIDEQRWHEAHHLLLFFGRYFCLAKKPNCDKCFYQKHCCYLNDKNLQD